MASPTAQKTPPQLSPRSSPGPPTPGPSKLRKPRASLAIELSSGSDDDDDDERAARLAANEKARAAERFKDRNRVKAAIPDVDPHVILEMFRNPEYHQDPDLIASAILESNYRLRDGGWKWGYDPEVGPSGDDLASGSGERDLQKKKVRRAENDSDTDSDSADDRRASSHKAEKAARKSAKQKRARQRSSDDEEQDDDEEVDQLASDNDGAGSGQDDAEEEEEEDLTREEVMEQEGYWLDPEERDPPEDSYRKAALNRLFRDYNKYAENHIRSRFESDECDGKYAPTWFDLRRLQQQGDLLPLKGPPRDMDAPIILQDGTKRARKPIEKSKTLEKEARWLAQYLKYGGKGLQKKRKKEEKKDQSKKRKKESLEARRARLSGGEAAQKKKEQKKKARVRADPDEEMRWSDDDLTPIASTSTSNKARVKAKAKPTPAKKRRVHFVSDDDDGECWDDLFGHGANTDGWGPAYQDKPSTSASKGQKKKQKPAVGSWASSSSGAFNVKEEEREWFLGEGRRLGD